MSRFEEELSGMHGEYFRHIAKNEIREIRNKIKNGEITIDTKGVGRDALGRPLSDEIVEKIKMITSDISEIETDKARAEYTIKHMQENRI